MSEPIKLHDLTPASGAKRRRTHVGHGEASKSKTVGCGIKGTKARKQVLAAFEGGQMPLHVHLPKSKDFKNLAKVVFQVINISDPERLFSNGGDITIANLAAKDAVRTNQLVKISGDDDINVFVNIAAVKFSGSAKSKTETAGGSIAEA